MAMVIIFINASTNVVILLHIRENPGSGLGSVTRHPDVFGGFPQPNQANSGTVLKLGHGHIFKRLSNSLLAYDRLIRHYVVGTTESVSNKL